MGLSEDDVGYTIRRSDRARRTRLTVTESGEVVVVLPRRAPRRDAAALVALHADWLERHVTKARSRQQELKARPPLAGGRVLDVDGVARDIRVRPATPGGPVRGRVTVSDGRLDVALGGDGRDAATLLDAWLRRQARRRILERVAARALEVGVNPGRVSIRDQRSRWGSASADGRLSFNWRLILAPPYVLDAVVVHELAHLRIRGHDRRFWALVEQHAPATPRARRWLREHGYQLRMALLDQSR